MMARPFIFDKKFFILLALLPLLVIVMLIFGIAETLDSKLYYTGEQARIFLSGLSVAQLTAYTTTEVIDLLLFIPAYTAVLYVGLKQMYPMDKKMCLLAFLPAFFDAIETGLIIYTLVYGLSSAGPDTFFDWLGLVTFFKWLLALGAVVALIRGAINIWWTAK